MLSIRKANRPGNHRIWGARPLPSIRQTVMIFQGDVDNQTAENIALPRSLPPSLPRSLAPSLPRSLMVRPRFSSMTGLASPPASVAVCWVLRRPSAKCARTQNRSKTQKIASATAASLSLSFPGLCLLR